MSNSTKVFGPKRVECLAALLATYRGALRTDEQRLQDAMREFERTLWEDRFGHAA